MSQGGPGEQSMHGGGTIVQYSGQDGSLVSYVPGEEEPLVSLKKIDTNASSELCWRSCESRRSITKAGDEVT